MHLTLALSVLLSLHRVASHAAIWHPSMWGYNVTDKTMGYDNRPVVPLANRAFKDWWFHGFLEYPPHPEDVFELPAGKNATHQIACNRGATSYFAGSEGGNVQNASNPNDVCPGSPSTQYHANNKTDLGGCALAIAYKDNVADVQPEDFAIFSVNHTCVWYRYTDFAVPARMPPCPNGMCICSFFWIHLQDSGSEQMYMNGFQCNVTGSTSDVPLATPKVARRCGADPANGKPNAVPGNCTYGPKQPLYWLQAEGNNMFEGYYGEPTYRDMYNYQDGPQNDIFNDSYTYMPVPGPSQTELPRPTPSWLLASGSASGAINGAGLATSSDALVPASPTPTAPNSVVQSTVSTSTAPDSVAQLTTSIPTASNSAVQFTVSTPTAPDSATQSTTSLPTASTDATSPSSTPSNSGAQCGLGARSVSGFSRRHAERAKARFHSREEWEI